MVGRKAGSTSGIAVRQETIEVQGMTIETAQAIVAKVVAMINTWEANNRYKNTPDEKEKLNELEINVCSHITAKAMRLSARPDIDNAMTQAEAGSIIFKTAKSWQRWENGTSPIALGDIVHFLLATKQARPIQR